LRLACLWVSQSARSLADWCLRLFVVLEVARHGPRERNFAPHLVTAVYIAPFILLAPTNGAISNALRKRWVLVAAAAFCLAGVLLVAALGWPWLLAAALLAVGMAVYSPTRYALLPAAAEDTRVPLPRVMGWIEMGAAAAIVGGALLGIALHDAGWRLGPLPPAVAVTVAASALALLTALPAHFAADVRRPEPPLEAIAGFFRDARRVLASPAARGSLLGLAAFMALVAAGAGALVSYSFDPKFADSRTALARAMALVAVGAAAGSWLAGRQGSLQRGLGLVPISATVLLAALAWAVLGGDMTGACVLVGLTTGLANVPLRSYYQAAVPADARGNGMSVMNTAIFVATTALSLAMFLLTSGGLVGGGLAQLALVALLALAFALAAWRLLYRQAAGQAAEILAAARRLGRLSPVEAPGSDEEGPLITDFTANRDDSLTRE
jgi:predicted MFS family arabinose efflux permease